MLWLLASLGLLRLWGNHASCRGCKLPAWKGYLHRDLKPSNVFCVSEDRFVIGDFGSVVARNDQGYAETKTRHSLLYRPPEELAEHRSYEQGDVYQLGLVLFQLLGGRLPYEEAEWLSAKELTKYDALEGVERQLFATGIIEEKIARGKIADLSTLPCWVPSNLVSVVRRCSQTNREKRFESAAALIAKLNNIRGGLPNWRIDVPLFSIVIGKIFASLRSRSLRH